MKKIPMCVCVYDSKNRHGTHTRSHTRTHTHRRLRAAYVILFCSLTEITACKRDSNNGACVCLFVFAFVFYNVTKLWHFNTEIGFLFNSMNTCLRRFLLDFFISICTSSLFCFSFCFWLENLTNWSREAFMTLPQSVRFLSGFCSNCRRQPPYASCLMPYALCQMPYTSCLMQCRETTNYYWQSASSLPAPAATTSATSQPQSRSDTHTLNNNNNNNEQRQQKGEEAGLKSVDVVFH